MSVSPARRAALEVVKRVREREAWTGPTLDAVLSAKRLTPEDAALATRLAYGTIEASGVLEGALDERLTGTRKLEPRVRDALLIGAYEVLFTRTPAHAAVSQWVEQVRSIRPQAAGLANAVLRRLAEDAASFPWGDPSEDLDALSRATLHPRWIVDEWIAVLGHERAREALYADAGSAPLYVRHVPFRGSLEDAVERLTEDGAGPEPTDVPGCILCRRPAETVRGSALSSGLVVVADQAAQVAPLVLGPHPGGIVVDAAAGRGTKTVEIQALSVEHGGPAHVYALDLHEFKTRVLRERLDDLGVPGVTALTGNAETPGAIQGLPSGAFADAVLLDAPCTGLGALRRHPEKRWRLMPREVDSMGEVQLRLVEGAATMVAEGGRLVYSTCSVSRAENKGVVDAFLSSSSGRRFVREHVGERVPAALGRFVDDDGDFQSWPTDGGPDGHYVAALRTTEG